MTLDIALVLGILAAAVVLFVTEWVRVDLTALLVLPALALSLLPNLDEVVQGATSSSSRGARKTLVMGPGGDRFIDHLKLGVPLIPLVFAAVPVVLPLIWSLT